MDGVFGNDSWHQIYPQREVRCALSIVAFKEAEVPHGAVIGNELVVKPDLGSHSVGSALRTSAGGRLGYVDGRNGCGGVIM